MSKIYFTTVYNSTYVKVIAGWNRVEQNFFLDILNDLNNQEIIYSSSSGDFSKSELSSTRKLSQLLQKFGIKIPNKFWAIVNLKESNATYNLGSI